MQTISMRSLVQNFISSLVGNFAVNQIKGTSNILELTYIRDVETLRGEYVFNHFYLTEKEIELKANATSYHLTEDGIVEKYDLDIITLNVDKTSIIPVTSETVVSLLLDNNKVIRQAAEDWYATTKLGRVLPKSRRGRVASQ